MGAFEGEKKLQLASMHTISKGFVGECGFRGGYCEFLGIPADVQAQILKLSSINLCPNTMGQVMIGLMSNPPKPGDPSHEQYVAERDAIKDGLKLRAKKLSNALNSLDRMSCTDIEGAMYAFPSIDMPGKIDFTCGDMSNAILTRLFVQRKQLRRPKNMALHQTLCTP